MDAQQLFELPVATLRIFQRAVQCIAKLGKDAALIFQPSQLVLRGADDGHSAALHFVFGSRLFRTVAVTGETKVVVVARQLLLPLSGAAGPGARQNAEGLTLRLAGQRILLEFSSRFGVKVRHGVPLLETLPFLPGDPAAGPHAAAMAPSLLAKVMQHCIPHRSGCEEVTLGAAVAEGLRVQSEDLTGEAGRHRTEVLVQMSDLEACHLDPSGGEVRLLGRGLRDFAKAAEVFARDLDSLRILDGSALLELRFGAASGSVLCSLAVALEGVAREIQGFRAVFSVAIRESSGSLPAPTPAPSAPPATAASASSRRAQPRQGAKRRAVEATLEDFDAFPEHSQRAVIDLTQLSSAPAAPAAPASPAGPAVPAVRASQGLPLFTAQQKAQMATQLSTQPEVPPSMPPPTVPATPLPSQNGRSQEIPGSTGSWWQGRATPPAQVMASLSRPAVSASPAPQPGVGNVGNTVLASHLENTDVLDSDDELIGADPDEIAFARGDQEEEAPDWFDCEKLW